MSKQTSTTCPVQASHTELPSLQGCLTRALTQAAQVELEGKEAYFPAIVLASGNPGFRNNISVFFPFVSPELSIVPQMRSGEFLRTGVLENYSGPDLTHSDMCPANVTNEYLLLCGTGLRRVQTGCGPQGHRLIRLGRQKCVQLSKQACGYAKYRTGFKTVLSLTSFGSRPPGHHWAQVSNVTATLDMVTRGTCGQRLTNKLSSTGDPPPPRGCVSVWEQDHRGNSIFPTKETTEETAGDSKTGQWLLTLHVMYQHPSRTCTGFGLSLHPEKPTYTAEYSHLHSHAMKMNKTGVS